MVIFLGEYSWLSLERLNAQLWKGVKMQGTRRHQCLNIKEVVLVKHVSQWKRIPSLGVIGDYH